MSETLIPIVLHYPVCIEGLSEDAVRELVKALRAQAVSDLLSGVVTAPAATQTKFVYDGAGNFNSITAIVNGQPTTLYGKELLLFPGPPTATNPGPGYKIEVELTIESFPGQGDVDSAWKIFVASRAPILNTVTSP